MDEIANLKEVESLISNYYEISKIRDEAERIRQFVKIDRMLKEYHAREIAPRETSNLKLYFTKKDTGPAGLKIFELHDITPAAEREGDLIRFANDLAKAVAYPASLSTECKDGG